MSLINVITDLSRVAAALERIADALETRFPLPPDSPPERRMSTMADYSRITDEEIIERQREQERQARVYGRPPVTYDSSEETGQQQHHYQETEGDAGAET